MNSDEEKAYEDALDGSGWSVPPIPERERCARICEYFAEMLEAGAGPGDDPAYRLRQAARRIREGATLTPKENT